MLKQRNLDKLNLSLNKLKEEIAKKNIEVLAITKDLEEWEMKRSGLSGKP